MKYLKKIAGFVLAMVMIIALNCVVFAADTAFPDPPTSTKADISAHTFSAYQIFKGDVTGGTLLNIDWGTGIKAQDFLAALKGSTAFNVNGVNPFASIQYEDAAPYKSADAVARVMQDLKTPSNSWGSDDINNGELTAEASDGRAREFARIADANRTEVKIAAGQSLSAGYYLVVDETTLLTGDNAVRNLSILQMVADSQFRPVNKTDVPELEKKVKEINDSDVTVTDKWGDVADYDIGDDVEFVLTGTLPTDYASYKTYKYVFHDTLGDGLTLNEHSVEVYIDDAKVESGFSVETTNIDGESLRVTFSNLKEINEVSANSIIRVAYTAKLSGTNVVVGGTGNENRAHLEYSNDPNSDGTGTPPTGTTPKDKVVVFTFQLGADKIDENGDALAGAGFSLYKLNKDTQQYEAYTNEGIDTIEKIDSEGNKYYEITGVTEFTFKGVDAGMYKLVETTVPAGYNKAEDMYFTIEAVIDEKTQSVTDLKIGKVTDADGTEITDAVGNAVYTFSLKDNDASTGTLNTSIVNLKGILLPSTGGIGTTIFYIVGGILVVGAGIILVARKRMNSR